MMILRALLTVLLLCSLPGSAWAQHCKPGGGGSTSTCGTANMAPPDWPMSGLGDLTFPVSTHFQPDQCECKVQKFFDQGLTLHYGFNNEAAILAFRAAAHCDESLAMADWGIALAATTNINIDSDEYCSVLARVHIKRAQEKAQRAQRITQKERDLINALAARFPSGKEDKADDQQLSLRYSRAMAEVYKKYPLDADVAVIYANSMMNLQPWRLWENCKPRLWATEIIEVLRSVLKRDETRDHLGANHFYIHALEGSCEPREAARSAEVLRKAGLTAAGHLVHMPSHIAMRMGDYKQAADDNEQAVKADEAVYAPACEKRDEKHCLPLYVGHYLGHNLFFWLAANQQLGRLEESKRIASKLEQLTKEYVQGEHGLEHYLSARVLTLARFRQWKQVLDVPAPAQELKMARAIWLWSRTMALVLGETKATQQDITAEYGKYHQAASEVSAELSWGNNKATAFFPLMDYLLSGHLAEYRGDRTEAIARFKLALSEQNRLVYDEPNPWSLNVRETLGGAYLREKNFAMAQRVFEEDLTSQYNPGNGRSLFGLWKSLEGHCSQGQVRSAKAELPKAAPADSCDPARLQKAQAAFEQAWKFADVKLTIQAL